MDKHDEGEVLSAARCLPPQAQASRAQAQPHSGEWWGGLRRSLYLRRQVTDWVSHLSGSSSDTLITVLGMLSLAH